MNFRTAEIMIEDLRKSIGNLSYEITELKSRISHLELLLVSRVKENDEAKRKASVPERTSQITRKPKVNKQ